MHALQNNHSVDTGAPQVAYAQWILMSAILDVAVKYHQTMLVYILIATIVGDEVLIPPTLHLEC